MGQAIEEAVVKREFDHSYLLIRADEVQMDSYSFFMITQNDIFGLLSCRIRYMEDIPYFSYDISSKKSLRQEYQDRKLHFQDVKDLFYNLYVILHSTEEFLLDKEGFLFIPEHIYKDLESEDIFCLYLPNHEKKKEEIPYRELADFLLDRTDHKDEHAVNCVYQFYKMSKEPYFSFEAFVGFLEKEELLFQAEKKRQTEKKNMEKEEYHSDRETFYQEEENDVLAVKDRMKTEKKTHFIWLPSFIMAAAGLLLMGLYWFVPYFRYFALYLLIPGICLLLIALLLGIRNGYVFYKKKEEPEWEMLSEPVTVEDYFDVDNETVYFEDEVLYQVKWKEGHFSKEFILKEFPVTVGKMKGSVALYIEDASVSRLHACFKEREKDIVLQDLDSTNGTYVNGKKLEAGETQVIRRGDEIQFGKMIVNVV